MDNDQLYDNVNPRSEEVQEIMGRVPHWILRRGIALIFLIVLMLLVGSYFFHYPEKVTTEVHTVSSIPDVSFTSQASGQLVNILVHNGDTVSRNQLLAVIECVQEESNKRDSLFSSMDGVVNTPEYLETGMWISPNVTLLVVVPLQRGQMHAYGQLSAVDIIRVNIGQQVIIRPNGRTDYDKLRGVVRSVSSIPDKDGKYFFDIDIETASPQAYTLKGEMPATAEIIVNDKRIIESLLQPFFSFQ